MPAKPAEQGKYVMPTPTAVVVWRNAPGAEPVFGIVTKVGRSAIDLLVCPPESRVGIPVTACRHVGDPLVRTQLSAESGVWDYTSEAKLLLDLARHIVAGPQGDVAPLGKETVALLATFKK